MAKSYIVNSNYMRGWKGSVMGFVLILLAFSAVEPLVTGFISDNVLPIIEKCHKVWLWALLFLLYIYLLYITIRGCKEKRYVSHRAYMMFVLPLCIILFYYGAVVDMFPSVALGNSYRISIVIILSIPMGVYTCTLLNCVFSQKVYISFFRRYKYTHDLAIKRKEDDTFGFTPYVERLALSILSTDVSKHSFSLAITGEWGMGKSSLMNLLCNELMDEDGNNIMWFNPRQSRSVETLQEDFMNQFGKVIDSYTQIPSIGSTVQRYIGELNIDNSWGVIKNLVNDLDRFLHEKGEYEITNILLRRGKPLYVFIDDLDRLTAPEMLEVFKLINKNAAFPYVYFLTAFDKTRVNHMLSNYIGLSKDENYSDKYFNGEYHLPEKDYFKVVNSMARLLSDKSKAYGMNIGGAIISGYWQQIQRTTVNVLKTPRDLIRFSNEFMAGYSNVIDDVVFVDLWYLMLIKYVAPKVYDDIAERSCLISLKVKDVIFYAIDNAYISKIGNDSAISVLLTYLFPLFNANSDKENPIGTSESVKNFLNSPSYCRLYLRKNTNTYLSLDAGSDCTNNVLNQLLTYENEESELLFEKLCKRHRYTVYSFLTHIIDEGYMSPDLQKRVFVLLMMIFGKVGDYFKLKYYLMKYLTKDEEFDKRNESKNNPKEDYVRSCTAYLLRKGTVKLGVASLLLQIVAQQNVSPRIPLRTTLKLIKDSDNNGTVMNLIISNYVELAQNKPYETAMAMMTSSDDDTIYSFNGMVPLKGMCRNEFAFNEQQFLSDINKKNTTLKAAVEDAIASV